MSFFFKSCMKLRKKKKKFPEQHSKKHVEAFEEVVQPLNNPSTESESNVITPNQFDNDKENFEETSEEIPSSSYHIQESSQMFELMDSESSIKDNLKTLMNEKISDQSITAKSSIESIFTHAANNNSDAVLNKENNTVEKIGEFSSNTNELRKSKESIGDSENRDMLPNTSIKLEKSKIVDHKIALELKLSGKETELRYLEEIEKVLTMKDIEENTILKSKISNEEVYLTQPEECIKRETGEISDESYHYFTESKIQVTKISPTKRKPPCALNVLRESLNFGEYNQEVCNNDRLILGIPTVKQNDDENDEDCKKLKTGVINEEHYSIEYDENELHQTNKKPLIEAVKSKLSNEFFPIEKKFNSTDAQNLELLTEVIENCNDMQKNVKTFDENSVLEERDLKVGGKETPLEYNNELPENNKYVSESSVLLNFKEFSNICNCMPEKQLSSDCSSSIIEGDSNENDNFITDESYKKENKINEIKNSLSNEQSDSVETSYPKEEFVEKSFLNETIFEKAKILPIQEILQKLNHTNSFESECNATSIKFSPRPLSSPVCLPIDYASVNIYENKPLPVIENDSKPKSPLKSTFKSPIIEIVSKFINDYCIKENNPTENPHMESNKLSELKHNMKNYSSSLLNTKQCSGDSNLGNKCKSNEFNEKDIELSLLKIFQAFQSCQNQNITQSKNDSIEIEKSLNASESSFSSQHLVKSGGDCFKQNSYEKVNCTGSENNSGNEAQIDFESDQSIEKYLFATDPKHTDLDESEQNYSIKNELRSPEKNNSIFANNTLNDEANKIHKNKNVNENKKDELFRMESNEKINCEFRENVKDVETQKSFEIDQSIEEYLCVTNPKSTDSGDSETEQKSSDKNELSSQETHNLIFVSAACDFEENKMYTRRSKTVNEVGEQISTKQIYTKSNEEIYSKLGENIIGNEEQGSFKIDQSIKECLGVTEPKITESRETDSKLDYSNKNELISPEKHNSDFVKLESDFEENRDFMYDNSLDLNEEDEYEKEKFKKHTTISELKLEDTVSDDAMLFKSSSEKFKHDSLVKEFENGRENEDFIEFQTLHYEMDYDKTNGITDANGVESDTIKFKSEELKNDSLLASDSIYESESPLSLYSEKQNLKNLSFNIDKSCNKKDLKLKMKNNENICVNDTFSKFFLENSPSETEKVEMSTNIDFSFYTSNNSKEFKNENNFNHKQESLKDDILKSSNERNPNFLNLEDDFYDLFPYERVKNLNALQNHSFFTNIYKSAMKSQIQPNEDDEDLNTAFLSNKEKHVTFNLSDVKIINDDYESKRTSNDMEIKMGTLNETRNLINSSSSNESDENEFLDNYKKLDSESEENLICNDLILRLKGLNLNNEHENIELKNNSSFTAGCQSSIQNSEDIFLKPSSSDPFSLGETNNDFLELNFHDNTSDTISNNITDTNFSNKDDSKCNENNEDIDTQIIDDLIERNIALFKYNRDQALKSMGPNLCKIPILQKKSFEFIIGCGEQSQQDQNTINRKNSHWSCLDDVVMKHNLIDIATSPEIQDFKFSDIENEVDVRTKRQKSYEFLKNKNMAIKLSDKRLKDTEMPFFIKDGTNLTAKYFDYEDRNDSHGIPEFKFSGIENDVEKLKTGHQKHNESLTNKNESFRNPEKILKVPEMINSMNDNSTLTAKHSYSQSNITFNELPELKFSNIEEEFQKIKKEQQNSVEVLINENCPIKTSGKRLKDTEMVDSIDDNSTLIKTLSSSHGGNNFHEIPELKLDGIQNEFKNIKTVHQKHIDLQTNENQLANTPEKKIKYIKIKGSTKDFSTLTAKLSSSQNRNTKYYVDETKNSVCYQPDRKILPIFGSTDRSRILDASKTIRTKSCRTARSRSPGRLSPYLISLSNLNQDYSHSRKFQTKDRYSYLKRFRKGNLELFDANLLSPESLRSRFNEKFNSYARNKRKQTDLITYQRSTKWLKDAGIVGSLLTAEEADNEFRNAAGVKIALNKYDYQRFLQKMTKLKNISYREIYEKLCFDNC